LGTNTIKPLALIFTTLASVSVGLHEQRRIITFAFVLVWRERERESPWYIPFSEVNKSMQLY